MAQLYELDVLTITDFPNRNLSDALVALDSAHQQYMALVKKRAVLLVGKPSLAFEPTSDKGVVNIVVRAIDRKKRPTFASRFFAASRRQVKGSSQ